MTFVEWSDCVDGLDRNDSTDTKLFLPELFGTASSDHSSDDDNAYMREDWLIVEHHSI